MKTKWVIVVAILGFSALSQSPKSQFASKIKLINEQIKVIVDSTKVYTDSANIAKSQTSDIIDDAKASNGIIKTSIQESKNLGYQVDRLTRIIKADKERVDLEVASIVKEFGVAAPKLPEVKIDSTSHPKPDKKGVRIFRNRP